MRSAMTGEKVPWRPCAGSEEKEDNEAAEEEDGSAENWVASEEDNPRGREFGIHLLFQLRKEGERHPPAVQDSMSRSKLHIGDGPISVNVPARSIVCHDEVGETAFGNIMKEVLFPNIGQFAVIGWDLGQNSLCGWIMKYVIENTEGA
jgi:hypothetical protein